MEGASHLGGPQSHAARSNPELPVAAFSASGALKDLDIGFIVRCGTELQPLISGRTGPCKPDSKPSPHFPRICKPCSFAPRGICRAADACNFCHAPGDGAKSLFTMDLLRRRPETAIRPPPCCQATRRPPDVPVRRSRGCGNVRSEPYTRVCNSGAPSRSAPRWGVVCLRGAPGRSGCVVCAGLWLSMQKQGYQKLLRPGLHSSSSSQMEEATQHPSIPTNFRTLTKQRPTRSMKSRGSSSRHP